MKELELFFVERLFTYFAKLDIMCNFVYNIKSRLFC